MKKYYPPDKCHDSEKQETTNNRQKNPSPFDYIPGSDGVKITDNDETEAITSHSKQTLRLAEKQLLLQMTRKFKDTWCRCLCIGVYMLARSLEAHFIQLRQVPKHGLLEPCEIPCYIPAGLQLQV